MWTRWLWAALLIGLGAVAESSVVERLPLSELVRRSDAIAVGQILATETQWSADHHHLYRRVTVQVEEGWKGSVPQSIVLLLRGGTLDGIEERVTGVPVLTDGTRAAFFLRRRGDLFTLVGLGQGVFELQRDQDGAQWGEQRLEELSLAGQSAGGEVALLRHGEGGLGRLRLEALRDAVGAIVRGP